jgi:hypothetical protein
MMELKSASALPKTSEGLEASPSRRVLASDENFISVTTLQNHSKATNRAPRLGDATQEDRT